MQVTTPEAAEPSPPRAAGPASGPVTAGGRGGEDEETSPGRALPLRVSRLRRRMFAGAAAALAYACALLVVASLSADLGFLSYQGGPVVLVDPGSPAAAAGLQVGDQIVAVDGVALPELRARQARIDAIGAGDIVTLTVARAGAHHQLTFQARRRVPVASAAGVALAAVLLALAMYADRGRRHDLPQAFFRSSLVYVIFLAGAFGLDVAIRSPALMIPWIYAMALAAPVTCRFMIRFPNGRRWFSRRELGLLYGPPLLVATVLAVNHLTFHLGRGSEASWAVGKIFGGAAALLAAVYLTVGAVARARRLRAKKAEIDPGAARWLHVGGVFMAVPLLAALVWATRDLPGFIAGGFRPFVAVAMVGGSAGVVMAMTRVPFGELDRLWRRSSGYVLATLLAAGAYLAVIGLLGGAASVLSGGELRIALAATLAAAVLFGPVRLRLQAMVDERFARNRTRARTLLREAAEAAVATLDIDALQRGVVERVRSALAADGVALYVAADDAWRREVVAGAVPTGDLMAGTTMARRVDAALTARAPRLVVDETVAVPLPTGDRRPAALVVAPRDGERLLDEDLELLSTVAANLVVALGNARAHRELTELTERLRREVDSSEQRRREIVRLKERLEEENRALVRELSARRGRPPVIGKGLAETFELVQRVGRTDATVLVRGETGVGKELVARAIHAASPRRAGPFVVVDCGAIAAGLIESALFGHERGAFTGAVRAALGAFRQAAGGTIFLDELGELPLELQPKLLRVLQEREVHPVGADRPEPIDVRVVCGTHRDLAAAAAAGSFRSDLLYRLQVVEIAVPPLRARKADIPELATAFLEEAAARSGRAAAKRLAPEALALLLAYDWPGNVRELEHALEAAAVYAEGDEIRAADLPIAEKHWRRQGEQALAGGRRAGEGEAAATGLKQTLEELERDRLVAVLAAHGGNRSAAARVLGLSRGALLRRLKRYRLDGET
jgi:transcriptional regulator with GAF, ATPase, and Fis domain